MSGIDWMDTPLKEFYPRDEIGDYDRLEKTGEVPIIRDTQRGYELLDELTLRDLPAVLDTFEVLEEELEKEKLEAMLEARSQG